MHHCLLCLGSNYEYATQLHSARTCLKAQFPDIRFSEQLTTEAIGEKWLSPFANQLAEFYTTLGAEEVRSVLKQMEKDHGRLPGDKVQGIVKLDIDLLMYDDEVLKPEDMQRDFVQRLLASIAY